MSTKPVCPEIELAGEITIPQRIELILDLTRRLGLLNDLLRTARTKREASDAEAILSRIGEAEFAQTVVRGASKVAPPLVM